MLYSIIKKFEKYLDTEKKHYRIVIEEMVQKKIIINNNYYILILNNFYLKHFFIQTYNFTTNL